MMADCAGFQAQIAAIMEILANSAVAEICKVVDEGYVKLRGQMEQQRLSSGEENQALRRELRLMDEKIRSYERKLRRRSPREETTVHRGGDWAAAEALEDHRTVVTLAASEVQDSYYTSKQEPKVMQVVKQEKVEQADCNLDLKVEVNITAECGLVTALEPSDESTSSDAAPDGITSSSARTPSPPSQPTADPACRRRTAHKAPKSLASRSKVGDGGGAPAAEHRDPQRTDCAPKLEVPADEAPPAAACEERLAGLGLDLAWMQERVGHLGAAYAVAQLGLGNAAPGRPPASFPAQAGGEGLDAPPAVLFSGGAPELAPFAASYDAASAAPPAAGGAVVGQRPCRAAAAAEPSVCSVCGRVLANATALELHQRVHTGERPFVCPHCGKGFAQPNNLRVHLLIHTGERRYRCTLCGKSFISSSHLKRHRTVHTQEKPYSCSRCGQSFSQMCSVRRHRQQSQCGL